MSYNPDYWRTYYAATADKIKARSRKWYHANRERSLKSRIAWDRNHPERAKKRNTAYRRRCGIQPRPPGQPAEVISERIRQRKRAWWHTPAGQLYGQQYRNSDRGRVARANAYARRRSRKTGGGGLRVSTWRLILESQDHLCYYCQNPFGPTSQATQDHMIPLSRGGLHTGSNIVAACLRCNQRKAARLIA